MGYIITKLQMQRSIVEELLGFLLCGGECPVMYVCIVPLLGNIFSDAPFRVFAVA